MSDYEQMIIGALRYALSRRSYIMSCTDEYISNMIKGDVSANFLDVCIEDIKGHYREVERGFMLSDGLHDWKPLMDKLANKRLNK